MKKILALMLTVCIMLSIAFATVYAADDDPDPRTHVAPIENKK